MRQFYVHGVPYAEASKYDASAVPTLLKMLQEPKEQDHWSNIVVTLGMIGDNSAVEPMIAFVERLKEKGALNRSQRRAKTAAIMSLGYLINKSGSQRALKSQALAEDLPAAAAARPLAAAIAGQGEDLSKYAVIGLALSGSKAIEALKSAQEALESSDQPMASPLAAVHGSHAGPDVTEMLDEALRANQEIADKGLAEYYGKSRGP